jgi:hypothetical protein
MREMTQMDILTRTRSQTVAEATISTKVIVQEVIEASTTKVEEVLMKEAEEAVEAKKSMRPET